MQIILYLLWLQLGIVKEKKISFSFSKNIIKLLKLVRNIHKLITFCDLSRSLIHVDSVGPFVLILSS